MFYRWSLKSTCWFWLPLVYLAWPSKTPDKTQVSLWHHSRQESFGRWLALSTGVTTFVRTALSIQSSDFPAGQIVVNLLAYDFWKMAPWQVCGLLTAGLTLAIWVLSDKAYRACELDPSSPPDPSYTVLLYWLARIRNVITGIYLLLALGYVVLTLTHTDPLTLPGWLSFLTPLYGPWLTPPG